MYLMYMHKEDLALNNLQWLICHKSQPNQTIFYKKVSLFFTGYTELFLREEKKEKVLKSFIYLRSEMFVFGFSLSL